MSRYSPKTGTPNYGYNIHPGEGLPRRIHHTHPASDRRGYAEESNFYRCKTCGFICKRGRDAKCPLCETELYWKVVR